MSAADPSDVRTDEVDGVRVLWVQDEEPLTARLHVRTGMADEPFRCRGWTHLVEHLVLAPFGLQPHAYGGRVDLQLTTFALQGTPDQVVDGLRVVAEGLGALPTARLDDERRLLALEAAGRRPGPHDRILAARFGALGLGATAGPEWGLPGAQPEPLRAWAAERTDAEHAVLTLTGAPPAGLRLPLPNGRTQPLTRAASARPAAPASVHEPGGLVVLGGTVPAGAAAAVLQHVLAARLVRVLRHERALSYSPGVASTRLDGATVHLMAHVDTAPADQVEVARVLADLLDQLCDAGPAPEELAAAQAGLTSPARLSQRRLADLHEAAWRALLGGPDLSCAARSAEVEGLQPQDVAVVARAFAADNLLGTAEPGAAPDRWPPVSRARPRPPNGEVQYRGAGDEHDAQLVVTVEGLGLQDGPDHWVDLEWSRLAGVAVWDDDGHLLQDDDGTQLLVVPTDWPDAARLAELLHRHVPPAVRAPQGPSPAADGREPAQEHARRLDDARRHMEAARARRRTAARLARRSVARAAVVLVPLAVAGLVVLGAAAFLVARLFGAPAGRAVVQFLAVMAAVLLVARFRRRHEQRREATAPDGEG